MSTPKLKLMCSQRQGQVENEFVIRHTTWHWLGERDLLLLCSTSTFGNRPETKVFLCDANGEMIASKVYGTAHNAIEHEVYMAALAFDGTFDKDPTGD